MSGKYVTFIHKQLDKMASIHSGEFDSQKNKIGATRCQILKLKCLRPAGGAYIAPTDPLAVFKGAYF